MTFDEAFEIVIGHEGGYVNNSADPGGETKYGISKRAYPHLNIAALSLDQAKSIYLNDYWKPSGCESVPDAIRYDLFDAAVNSGNIQAVKWLQQACGAVVDGHIGPKTIAAANAANGEPMRRKFNGYRLQFMTELATWSSFGKGWARRIASNLINH